MTKRALEDAKAAKDEAKRLKKELDEAADNLAKSKEHSQKLDKRFREVIAKLSGNFSLFLVENLLSQIIFDPNTDYLFSLSASSGINLRVADVDVKLKGQIGRAHV